MTSAAGKDADHITTDNGLKALRECDDFKKLVAKLEAAAGPVKKPNS